MKHTWSERVLLAVESTPIGEAFFAGLMIWGSIIAIVTAPLWAPIYAVAWFIENRPHISRPDRKETP